MTTDYDPRTDPDYQEWLAGRRPAEPVPEPEPDPEPTADADGDEGQDDEPEPEPQPVYAASLHPEDAIGAPRELGHPVGEHPGLGAGVSN
jgi:hypothetical protein